MCHSGCEANSEVLRNCNFPALFPPSLSLSLSLLSPSLLLQNFQTLAFSHFLRPLKFSKSQLWFSAFSSLSLTVPLSHYCFQFLNPPLAFSLFLSFEIFPRISKESSLEFQICLTFAHSGLSFSRIFQDPTSSHFLCLSNLPMYQLLVIFSLFINFWCTIPPSFPLPFSNFPITNTF